MINVVLCFQASCLARWSSGSPWPVCSRMTTASMPLPWPESWWGPLDSVVRGLVMTTTKPANVPMGIDETWRARKLPLGLGVMAARDRSHSNRKGAEETLTSGSMWLRFVITWHMSGPRALTSAKQVSQPLARARKIFWQAEDTPSTKGAAPASAERMALSQHDHDSV